MAKIKTKPIPFNDNEKELLKWAEGQDKPFATYVKDLIREDIKKHKQYKKEDLKDIIKELLQEMNYTNTVFSNVEVKKSSKRKNAIKDILNKTEK